MQQFLHETRPKHAQPVVSPFGQNTAQTGRSDVFPQTPKASMPVGNAEGRAPEVQLGAFPSRIDPMRTLGGPPAPVPKAGPESIDPVTPNRWNTADPPSHNRYTAKSRQPVVDNLEELLYRPRASPGQRLGEPPRQQREGK